MSESMQAPISSSELGNLWLTYQEKTMILRFIEHFLEHTEDQNCQEILQRNYEDATHMVTLIKMILQKEGSVAPVGFTANDVNKGVPKLFDFFYDLVYLRMMSKVETGLFALFSTMSYRQDIRQLFNRLTSEAQETHSKTTEYLLEKGVLSRSPYVSMPQKVEFVHDRDYMTGTNLFGRKRSLNTVEVSLLYHAIETNLSGMQLMIGFAQVANDNEVKQYFVKGMDLSRKIETELGDILRESYIEPPASPAGKATASTVAPFSDKIMMYNTNLLCASGLGSNALGGAFSLRSDLPRKMASLAKDIFSFTEDGGKLMVKNGWMEEPPQVEDRNQLTESRI